MLFADVWCVIITETFTKELNILKKKKETLRRRTEREEAARAQQYAFHPPPISFCSFFDSPSLICPFVLHVMCGVVVCALHVPTNRAEQSEYERTAALLGLNPSDFYDEDESDHILPPGVAAHSGSGGGALRFHSAAVMDVNEFPEMGAASASAASSSEEQKNGAAEAGGDAPAAAAAAPQRKAKPAPKTGWAAVAQKGMAATENWEALSSTVPSAAAASGGAGGASPTTGPTNAPASASAAAASDTPSPRWGPLPTSNKSPALGARVTAGVRPSPTFTSLPTPAPAPSAAAAAAAPAPASASLWASAVGQQSGGSNKKGASLFSTSSKRSYK